MKAKVPARAAPGRHVYDVIVVGSQLGGALAAAVLAKRGLAVLLVPHHATAWPYLHQGFLLPHAPFLMPPPKVVELFEELVAEVGLSQAIHRALAQPALQLLEPDTWFELKERAKERATELKRALGADATSFEAAWEQAVAQAEVSEPFFRARLEFPPEGPLARWRLNRALPRFSGLETGSPLPPGSLLRSLLSLAAPVAQPGPLTEARALGRLLAGPSTFPGGREALWQLFADRAQELGTDVVSQDEVVEELHLGGTSSAHVRLKGLPTPYRAPVVVAAMDVESLIPLLPEGRHAAFRKAAAQLPVTRRLFTVNLVVPESGLPRGLGELALVRGTPNLVLQVSPARGAGVAASGGEARVLTVAMEVPGSPRLGDEATTKQLLETLWPALEAIMPFTRSRALLTSVPALHAPAVADGREDPAPMFQVPTGSWFGLSGLPVQAPARHLLLASRQVFPGLGLEGEALAVLRVVQRLERALPRGASLKASRA